MATIVSFRKKFVFIHITKAAGTSVTNLLKQYSDPPILSSKLVRNGVHIIGHHLGVDLMQYTGRFILPLHSTATMLLSRYPNLNFHDFYRFAIVRNPWDRLVSLYSFSRLPRKRYTHPLQYEQGCQLSFSEFAEQVCKNSPMNQVDYLFQDPVGNLEMDYIAKTERLDSDIKIILNTIGLPNAEVQHLNSTNHHHYISYYNDETQKLVASAFARDIELLNYEFGH